MDAGLSSLYPLAAQSMRISPFAPLVPVAPERAAFFGMLRSRTILVPTWRGVCAIVAVALVAAIVVVRSLYGFLAVQDPVRGGVMVIEGWVDDYVLEAAISEFRAHAYRGMWVTGEPIQRGSALAEYGDNANLSVSALEKMGVERAVLHPVKWDSVRQDRTYASAVALKHRLLEEGVSMDKLNIITNGAHARRSRLLYQKAFGSGPEIGVMAIPDPHFDPAHWWRSSAGVRFVIDESIAYIYARFFFRGK
jgi:hypothetical protein